MADSSEELKGLLLEVLKTVQEIKQDHGARLDRIETRLDRIEKDHGARLDRIETRLDQNQADHTERLDRIESEQRQIKEMIGVVRLREIGRLDGRIDQLSMDAALGRKAS